MFSLLANCKRNVFYLFFRLSEHRMTDLRVLSVPRGRNRLALSFRSICFPRSYIEGTMTNSITKRFIDNFGRVGRIIKRRATKSRSRALSCLHYGTREAATRRLILSREGTMIAAARQRENGKGEMEKDRPNEWRGIDTKNIGYTTEYASTILLSPFCPLLFIPTLLPRPTWPAGLRTACVHARINKRSIHYL